jgi:hypothetical protein
MAGRFDIQRIPKGLVDLFGMKGTGDAPHTLADTVFASVDSMDLYLVDRMVPWISQTGVAPTVIGFLIASIAPTGPAPGEQWLISSAGIRMPAIAAATAITINFVLQRVAANAVGTVYESIAGPLVLPASTGGFVTEHFAKPVIARPGDTLGVFVSNITGVPASQPQLWMTYTPLGV